jgi:hypothetical protein
MQEHRGEMLAEFLTIARGWIVAGRPGKKIRSDSYAEWLRALRGMMQWAGFQGSFGSGTSTVSVSADDEEWHTFLDAGASRDPRCPSCVPVCVRTACLIVYRDSDLCPGMSAASALPRSHGLVYSDDPRACVCAACVCAYARIGVG